MSIIFLADPIESMVIEKDTTFALMNAAINRGHTVYHAGATDIRATHNAVEVVSKCVSIKNETITTDKPVKLKDSEIRAIVIRLEPPFDQTYLRATWLIDQIKTPVFITNTTHGLRTVNEKLWALQFSNCIPHTVVTACKIQFMAVLSELKTVILKPTDAFGGQGIFKLTESDSNAGVAFEVLSQNGKQPVIIQAYIPEANEGDKRILLLNGDILGAVMRIHCGGEHRNNLFAGGRVEPATVTDRDRHIVSVIKPKLIELGLHFVGIDILGDQLIEINVTSPTCIREMSRFQNTDLANDVIRMIEANISQL